MLASLLLFTGCADYLDQDPEDLNSMDKIFSSKIETTKWYNRIYSDDFMVQEMHYSGQIPYSGAPTNRPTFSNRTCAISPKGR